MRILVTGAAGFIGKNFYKHMKKKTDHELLGVDCLTYAADQHFFIDEEMEHGNIGDLKRMKTIFEQFRPEYVINFAAESHVDNSIVNDFQFLATNVAGVRSLLQLCVEYKATFHQISTDEVFGDMDERTHNRIAELNDPYNPSSPYAASKAAADQLVLAYNRTYGVKASITYCTNNFGPGQHEEKFIPKAIMAIRKGEEVPVYGEGTQERQWMYVKDHVKDLRKFIEFSKDQSSVGVMKAAFGTGNIVSNILLVDILSTLLNEPMRVKHVTDRLGHDRAYNLMDVPMYTKSRVQDNYGYFEKKLEKYIKNEFK